MQITVDGAIVGGEVGAKIGATDGALVVGANDDVGVKERVGLNVGDFDGFFVGIVVGIAARDFIFDSEFIL